MAQWTDRSLDRVHDVVRPYLAVDEPIVATLPILYTLPRGRWWLVAISPYLGPFVRRYWALVLTDQRLIVCDCGGAFSQRPRAVSTATARDEVRLVAVKRRVLIDKLDIENAGKTTRYRAIKVRRQLRAWNDAFIAAMRQPGAPLRGYFPPIGPASVSSSPPPPPTPA